MASEPHDGANLDQVCTYTLDGVGNLKTMWEGGSFPKTFTFNAADRLVTMVEGSNLTTYAWTGYGALESEITGNSTTGYAYNGQDQLAVVTDPSGDKTTYSFDGDGLRRSVATTNQSQDPPTLDVTTMVWDGSDYLLLNEPTQNRVVLTLDSEIVACGSKDLLTDPLGSLVKEISSGASLGGLVQMTPYGTLLPTSGKVSIPFVYIAAYGYYNDTPDRDYVRARELYKKLGRWMQTDPLWPGERAVQYAKCSPIYRSDPDGLRPRRLRYIGRVDWPWSYGAYCGSGRVQNPAYEILPQDCLDSCCRDHDRCLEANQGFGNSNALAHMCCDYKLLKCARWAYTSNCCDRSENPKLCRGAALDVVAAFGALVNSIYPPPGVSSECVPESQYGCYVRIWWGGSGPTPKQETYKGPPTWNRGG